MKSASFLPGAFLRTSITEGNPSLPVEWSAWWAVRGKRKTASMPAIVVASIDPDVRYVLTAESLLWVKMFSLRRIP